MFLMPLSCETSTIKRSFLIDCNRQQSFCMEIGCLRWILIRIKNKTKSFAISCYLRKYQVKMGIPDGSEIVEH